MKFCTACGAKLEDSAVFCSSCLTQLAELVNKEASEAETQPELAPVTE